jgi:MFS family permease
VEATVFRKVRDEGKVARVPLGAVLRSNWRELILGTFIMLATYVLFYFMTTFTLNYGTSPNPNSPKQGLGYDKNTFLALLLVGVVFFGVFTPIAGWLADRFGRRRVLIITTALIIVFGLTFQLWFAASKGSPLSTGVFLAVGLALMGLTFGPMGALLPELFPTRTRYTGSGVSYNVASILGASLAPFIAAAFLWQADGDIFLVGLYLSVSGVLTLVALILVRETRDIELDTEEGATSGALAP